MGSDAMRTTAPAWLHALAINMTQKTEVLAYDREKRIYKEAYVDNFRRVRHFPSLATIGAGKSDGQSIILVQEPISGTDDVLHRRPSKFDNVASRLMPPDTLEQLFERTPPLTSFRSAVMCKHTKARHEQGLSTLADLSTSNQAQDGSPTKACGMSILAPFKPPNTVEAKASIERKITYDAQEFSEKPKHSRTLSPRPPGEQWNYNNPVSAKEEIRSTQYFHLPPDGIAIKADRKYTQEYIRLTIAAQRARKRQQKLSQESSP
ncbi:TPA: hypothetical protein N0F65_001208 [Lagenidium giganteum]|uniref:Uncharacterized protein n=1 Tax=Lagenidium giganteum TaxID=4803 RepID=A0AAV2Z4R3_9STRA|nr:TPA: hypothetical protein N0F65_001208 [Lagenidium giganteum]